MLLWLVMEEVCDLTSGSHVALFSDNAPTVSWVNKLASKNSQVADQLIRALALRLKLKGASPLSTMHIAGDKNEMTDIPSGSFGSEKKWFCREDKFESELFELYNSQFPLPDQNLWTVFRPSQKIMSLIFSALRTEVLEMDEWRRLPKPGRHTGKNGVATANLFGWTITCRGSASKKSATQLSPSQQPSDMAGTQEGVESELERYRRRSRPLIRRSPWTSMSSQSRRKGQRTSFR